MDGTERRTPRVNRLEGPSQNRRRKAKSMPMNDVTPAPPTGLQRQHFSEGLLLWRSGHSLGHLFLAPKIAAKGFPGGFQSRIILRGNRFPWYDPIRLLEGTAIVHWRDRHDTPGAQSLPWIDETLPPYVAAARTILSDPFSECHNSASCVCFSFANDRIASSYFRGM